MGTPKMFPKPEGDISLSPGGDWFVNGYGDNNKNYYAVYRRSDGAFVRVNTMTAPMRWKWQFKWQDIS